MDGRRLSRVAPHQRSDGEPGALFNTKQVGIGGRGVLDHDGAKSSQMQASVAFAPPTRDDVADLCPLKIGSCGVDHRSTLMSTRPELADVAQIHRRGAVSLRRTVGLSSRGG